MHYNGYFEVDDYYYDSDTGVYEAFGGVYYPGFEGYRATHSLSLNSKTVTWGFTTPQPPWIRMELDEGITDKITIIITGGTHYNYSTSYDGMIIHEIEFESADTNPPLANAGDDQIVFDEVFLDASLSQDEDGVIVSYEWELKHRADSSYDRIATDISPTVSDLAPGFYDVLLTVKDNDGKAGTDELVVGAIGKKGDLDLDGVVDGKDLKEFAVNFGN